MIVVVQNGIVFFKLCLRIRDYTLSLNHDRSLTVIQRDAHDTRRTNSMIVICDTPPFWQVLDRENSACVYHDIYFYRSNNISRLEFQHLVYNAIE